MNESNVRNPARTSPVPKTNKDYPDNNVKDFTDCLNISLICMTPACSLDVDPIPEA